MDDVNAPFPTQPDENGRLEISPDLLPLYSSLDYDFVRVEPDPDLVAKFEVRSKLTQSLCGYFMLPLLPEGEEPAWAATPPEGVGEPPGPLLDELIEFMLWSLYGKYRYEVFAEACPDDHPFKGYITREWPTVAVEPCETHGEHEVLVHREGTIAISWVPLVDEFDVVTYTEVISTEKSVEAAVEKAEEALRLSCN